MAMKVRYTTVNGRVIAEKRNGVRSFYVSDSLGSTVALIDNTQTITDTFEYWPYGEVRTRTGTNPTPLQFVGTRGYHTDSSSKSYVRARTLDTQKGRWMTKDPLVSRHRRRISIWIGNPYQYVYGSPLTYFDRSGKQPSPPATAPWPDGCTRFRNIMHTYCDQDKKCVKCPPMLCPELLRRLQLAEACWQMRVMADAACGFNDLGHLIQQDNALSAALNCVAIYAYQCKNDRPYPIVEPIPEPIPIPVPQPNPINPWIPITIIGIGVGVVACILIPGCIEIVGGVVIGGGGAALERGGIVFAGSR